ncbi:MAG: urea transporter [Acidithiobacillales bacterium SG8_45]|nr:MAG: urea transporter [Acidithiobacillales bacterium SG8_45]
MNSVNSAVLDANTGWLILALFSALWIALGWFWGRKARQLDDYMLAGRNVGLALGTATAMATWVTSNTTLVAPQFALQLGIWGMLGYSLGSVGLMLFAPMVKRIRQLVPHGYTSGDFIRMRYGTWTWRVFLVISMCYALGWLISLGMAGGILIHALTGIQYELGMTVILVICVSYTLLGGLRAVIGTDFIQTLLILLGIIILAVLTITEIGFDTMHQNVLAERPELLNLLMPAAIMFLFNNLLFGIGEIFHSNVWWSRAFAFRENVGFRAYLIAGIVWAPIPIVAGFIALAVPSLGLNVPAADMVGPMVAAKLLGFTGAVIVFIVVFSSLASSLDSLLAATSDLILQDIYRGHINPDASDERLRIMAKRIILLLGVLTWMICLPRVATLGSLLQYLGAFVASTIWPIIAGLYWQRTNANGALLAMVLGTVTGIWAYFAVGFYVAALVSAAVSMLIVVISTWIRPSHFDWTRLASATGADRS